MLSSLIITLSILGSFDGEFIFPPNDKHNHSSSIVECSDGSLLACWFHGTGERESDDVVIQGARKRAGESNWSEVFPMADSPDLPDCNPVLFLDSRQVLWLFWVAILDNEWGSALLKYKRATEYLEDGPPDWDWQDVIHMRPQGIEERFFPMMDEGLVTYDDLIETLIPGKKKELHEWRKRGEDKLVQRLGWMPPGISWKRENSWKRWIPASFLARLWSLNIYQKDIFRRKTCPMKNFPNGFFSKHAIQSSPRTALFRKTSSP